MWRNEPAITIFLTQSIFICDSSETVTAIVFPWVLHLLHFGNLCLSYCQPASCNYFEMLPQILPSNERRGRRKNELSKYLHAVTCQLLNSSSSLCFWSCDSVFRDSSTSSWDVLPSNRPAPMPRSPLNIMTFDLNILTSTSQRTYPFFNHHSQRPIFNLRLDLNTTLSISVYCTYLPTYLPILSF